MIPNRAGVEGERGQNIHLLCIFVFQFLNWCKPSEPFFADYVLPKYNITPDVLVTEVYSWDTFSQLGMGLVAALAFLQFGHSLPLLLCASGAAAQVSVVILSDTTEALVISQFLWGLSFASTFIVPASLFVHMSPRYFQTASSVNCCAMLCGTLLSSFVGFVVTKFYPDTGTGFTFYISLGCALSAWLVLAVSLIKGWIPTHRRRRHSEEASRKTAHVVGDKEDSVACFPEWKRPLCVVTSPGAGEANPSRASTFCLLFERNLRSATVSMWLITSALARAVHTQILTLWPLLSLNISPSPSEQSFNGLISASAYMGSAVVVLVPMKLECWVKRCTIPLIACTFLGCGASLAAMSIVNELWLLGVLLTCYHCLVEGLLAVASVQMISSLRTGQDDVDFEAQYLSILASKYALSLLIEALMQILIWPRWGHINNALGLNLTVPAQFRAFACVVLGWTTCVLVYYFSCNSCKPQSTSKLTASADGDVADASMYHELSPG